MYVIVRYRPVTLALNIYYLCISAFLLVQITDPRRNILPLQDKNLINAPQKRLRATLVRGEAKLTVALAP